MAVTQDIYYSPLANPLRAEGDGIVGGALGGVWGGHGRTVAAACVLSTVSLQAHPFCERCGSVVFGELPDHPAGQTLYFMKML